MRSRWERGSAYVVPGLAVVLATVASVHGCGRGSPGAGRTEPGGDSGTPAPQLPLREPEPSPMGNVSFDVRDAGGVNTPCKLTFVGRDGTRDPQLSRELPSLPIDGGIAANQRVFSLTGHGSLSVPDGHYEVYVSHGPEWTLHVEPIEVGPAPVSLAVKLEHVVRTDGWLSADLHVHAAPSWDSNVPVGARVHEFVAEGVDVLVATDHNVVTDYRPEIARSSADRSLGTVAGTEISTVDSGHFGAFPVADDKGWWFLRGVRMKGLTPVGLLAAVRRHAPGALLTVNHPRLGKMGYFNTGGFDPGSARFTVPKASLQFDALEVMNGAKAGDLERVDKVCVDWFSLLRNGHRVTAVGNSDTHDLARSFAGYPRNYVQLGDSGADVDGERLAAALREGRSYFTSGPVLDVDIDGKSFGETVRAKDGVVKLAVRVRAAPWISVSRVRVFVNGLLQAERKVAVSREPERFSEHIELELTEDAFVVVRVEGDQPLPPVVGGLHGQSLNPIAMTNPIYVDFDGDGRYR